MQTSQRVTLSECNLYAQVSATNWTINDTQKHINSDQRSNSTSYQGSYQTECSAHGGGAKTVDMNDSVSAVLWASLLHLQCREISKSKARTMKRKVQISDTDAIAGQPKFTNKYRDSATSPADPCTANTHRWSGVWHHRLGCLPPWRTTLDCSQHTVRLQKKRNFFLRFKAKAKQ